MSDVKVFRVGKRFSVWIEKRVAAASLSEAVQKAEKLGLKDFIKEKPGSDLQDWEPLEGTSVSEDW